MPRQESSANWELLRSLQYNPQQRANLRSWGVQIDEPPIDQFSAEVELHELLRTQIQEVQNQCQALKNSRRKTAEIQNAYNVYSDLWRHP